MANNICSCLIDGIKEHEPVTGIYADDRWTAVETATGTGMCMYVPDSDCRKFAYINSQYNRGNDFYEPFENYCTSGIDFCGKTVGVVGHLSEVISRHSREAKKIYVFEMQPKDETDLPAEMEDELLPECDIVIATGSSLVNGTLPHLLELGRKAYFVLTGPSVPKCRALLDFGIDRLAGMCITDPEGLKRYIKNREKGKPYSFGLPFLIKK